MHARLEETKVLVQQGEGAKSYHDRAVENAVLQESIQESRLVMAQVRTWPRGIKVCSEAGNFEGVKRYAKKSRKIAELVENKKLKEQYVPTSENIADMFTKALGPQQFEKLRRLLGVEDVVDVVDQRVGATIVQVKSSTDVHHADDENDKDTYVTAKDQFTRARNHVEVGAAWVMVATLVNKVEEKAYTVLQCKDKIKWLKKKVVTLSGVSKRYWQCSQGGPTT
ncbi:Copia-type Polyprotein [Phytophthora cinnamomi]|uniref:Copia-type Polyprotein n=1 Tax=Phytophthora cinnamomi TaxID=4785 RepID=UPI00355A075D|nr:Copia-type Polyprotein [Phytophthora cinnamomi]